ncbi:MAG: SpoIVB peptidase [Clostridia bacterium]|nr:SpoIVB peptidase [Clostridia bacterium]
MKKRLQIFCVELIAIATVMFVELGVYFPKEIHLFSGESLSIPKTSPYTLDTAVSGSWNAVGEYEASVMLFGLIPVKKVEVAVEAEKAVIPGGRTVGIKLFTHGLMCVGTEELTGEDGTIVNAEKQADIRGADMILKADDASLHTVEQLGKIVEQSQGKEITLTVERGGEKREVPLTPVKTGEGFRLGIWVRDSTAGIGTVTFIEPETGKFGALGHPITDVDTGAVMPVEQGSIAETEIVDVKKGERGNPGELCGLFDESNTDCGVILKNSSRGIFGVAESAEGFSLVNVPIPIASASQVRAGSATVYANVDGTGIAAYNAEIVKVMKHAADDKNLVVKITDQTLLNRTGGIVQGMSGSPIIQNGKLIGAVTHVFVNDPTRGYGIFIENMLAEAEKIK